jgi:ribosomal protein S1
MARRSERASPPPGGDGGDGDDGGEHGAHTVRVWEGVVTGVYGDDVFVELGPRMQGVISRRQFDEEPAVGAVHTFTVLGQEEGLWALARAEDGLLASWRDMERGSWVQGRVTGTNPGGLELKIGPLHAFMPKSETGLERRESPRVLVGKILPVEVIDVDRERQRVFVSRKAVLRKERASERQRQAGALRPGQRVQGRVTRIEPYGAFVRFGHGLEGLIHVSNLSYERVGHPAEVLKEGMTVEAEVLTVRRDGKRIGLGVKQLHASPWKRLLHTHPPDRIVTARVTRLAPFGAFLAIAPGVEGLLHDSASGLGPTRRLADVLRPGDEVPVRIVAIDVDAERMSLSRLHRDGALVRAEDVLELEQLASLERIDEPAATNLGRLLREAEERRRGQ